MEVFLAEPPPTGPVGGLREAEQSTRSVLRDLFPPVVLHRDGPPRATALTEEDHVASEMSNTASIHAQVQGQLLASALRRIKERYGVPPLEDLTALLSRDGTSDALLARSLAKALRHFWNDDYESCVHVVVPKVEAAGRSLLRELDEGVYGAQVGQTPGGYPGLGTLLDELDKLALDESWSYFLRWLLLGPYGENIRNDVAHGFVTDADPAYAALVLRAAAVLVTVAAPGLGTDDEAVGPIERRPREEILGILRSPHHLWRAPGGHLLNLASAALGRVWWWVEGKRVQNSVGGRRRTEPATSAEGPDPRVVLGDRRFRGHCN